MSKHPKVFNNLNDWEVWSYRELYRKYSDVREFNKNTTIEAEMQKMGYDGVIILGREMVNYAPPHDVTYCRDEDQVKSYWRTTIKGDI
jgi:hypothetical protein